MKRPAVLAGVGIGGVIAAVVIGTVIASPAASSPTVPQTLAAVAADLSAAQSQVAAAGAIYSAQPTPTVTITASPLPGPTVTVTATPPTPTPTPTPTSASTRPSAANTGVPAGTALTVHTGNLTISTAGQVVSGLDIHGFVKVTAPNVTIKDSIIRGAVATSKTALIYDLSNAATNLLVEDTTLLPSNPSVDIDGIDGWNFTALRLNISGTVDGSQMFGPNATMADSYIHGLIIYQNDPAQNNGPSHNDGVQILSGTNLKITGNTIVGVYGSTLTNSAAIISQDHGAVTGPVLISGNYLTGGGTCTLLVLNKPLPALSGVTITNNRFVAPLSPTCQILDSKTVTLVQTGNVIDSTGGPIKLLSTASTS